MDAKKEFDGPTRHLSMFFDNYFIASEEGTIVFAGDPPQLSHHERRHRNSTPFASLAKISDLLVDTSPSPLTPFSSGALDLRALTASTTQVGHSVVRNVQVDDVDLSVFVHPFLTNTFSKDPTYAPTLYMVGVIRRSSLANEAIRIRLGTAVDATFVIMLLLALLPILRFWTGGERSISGRINLYGMGASVAFAAALATTLALSIVSKHADGHALDQRLASISADIVRKFGADLRRIDAGLKEDLRQMLYQRTTAEQCSGSLERANIRSLKERFCRCLSNVINSPPRLTPRWMPTSSYILDEKGERTICKQYRKGQRLPMRLDLAFRQYFQGAKEDVVDLYRIDSVVRGQKQIAASMAIPKDVGARKDNAKVAVSLIKMHSIDGVVLPPHFQYAVIDASGATLFHSDEDRVSVSNFIQNTGNDPAIQTAMHFARFTPEYGPPPVVSVDYDGVPIRAHLRRLHKRVDWTLVVFRSHALVDRVSSLTTSLTVGTWLVVATLLVTMVVAPLAAFLSRSRKMTTMAVMWTCTSGVAGGTCALFGVVGLVVASQSRTTAPFVGVVWPAAIAMIVLVLAWWRYAAIESSTCKRSSHNGEDAPIWRRVLAIASVAFSFSVVPTYALYTYYRAELSGGLTVNVRVELDEALRKRLRDFDDYVEGLLERRKGHMIESVLLRRGISGFASSKEEELATRTQRKQNDDPHESVESTWFSHLWPLLAYSPLTQQVMWYAGVEDEVHSISEAIDHVAGPMDPLSVCGLGGCAGRPGGGTDRSPSANLWAGHQTAVMLFLLLLFIFTCYSTVRLIWGYTRRVGKLPSFSLENVDSLVGIRGVDRAKCTLLVKRSERDVRKLVEALGNEDVIVKCLRQCDGRTEWKDMGGRVGRRTTGSDSTAQHEVYLIEDFREAIEVRAGARLAQELRTMITDDVGNISIVICSDVLPAYHLQSIRSVESASSRPTSSDDWGRLINYFDVRVLCGDDWSALRLEAKLEELERWPTVSEALAAELMANQDLAPAVRGAIGRLVGGRDSPASQFQEVAIRRTALRDFRAVAQARFKTLWAASSLDERLQLTSLAHGGSLNMRRPAAISSLVNRGLVTGTDPMQLRSEAFGRFIVEDLDESLDDWRLEGRGNWWRVTWLPLVLLAGLGLLFFINSNPEAVGVIAAIGAAFIGLLPAMTSLFRAGQVVQPADGSSGD